MCYNNIIKLIVRINIIKVAHLRTKCAVFIKFMEEIWKDIKDYEGLYQISNLGNIKSKGKQIVGKITRRKINRIKKDKIKKIYSRGISKYMSVLLCKNNKPRNFYIHKLLAQTFIDNPLNKSEVNHIDGNKFNNSLNNLEWVTHKENMQHAWKIGLKKPVNEIPISQYDLKGNFIKRYISCAKAEFETGASNIYRVACGNRKTSGSFIWKY